jgi:hypothetical protein
VVVSPFDRLQSLDVCFNGEYQLRGIVSSLAYGGACTTLKRLSLSIHPESRTAGKCLVSALGDTAFPRFTRLREVCLSNIHDVDILFTALSRSMDFATLLRLNVLECYKGDAFFSALSTHIRRGPVALAHLALSILDRDDGTTQFLSSCHNLTTLHINIWDDLISPTFLRTLIHIVPFLRTFAIHQVQLDSLSDRIEAGQVEAFGVLLRSACTLRFLGYQLDYEAVDLVEGEEMSGFRSFLVSPLQPRTSR